MTVETAVFLVAAAIVLAGAGGVILSRNPVHAALSLVASLFGIAVLFVAQEAHLLAAVQVIVYTGAIVVLILFVLMLLGVDKDEDLREEPIHGHRPMAVLAGGLGLAAISAVLVLPVVNADEVEFSPTDSFGSPLLDVDGQPVTCTRTATFDELVTGERSATDPLTEPDLTTPAPVPEADADADPCAEPEPSAQVATAPNIEQVGAVLFTDYVYAFEVTALLLTIAVVGAVMMAKRVRDPQPLPPDPEPHAGLYHHLGGGGDDGYEEDDGARGDGADDDAVLVGEDG